MIKKENKNQYENCMVQIKQEISDLKEIPNLVKSIFQENSITNISKQIDNYKQKLKQQEKNNMLLLLNKYQNLKQEINSPQKSKNDPKRNKSHSNSTNKNHNNNKNYNPLSEQNQNAQDLLKNISSDLKNTLNENLQEMTIIENLLQIKTQNQKPLGNKDSENQNFNQSLHSYNEKIHFLEMQNSKLVNKIKILKKESQQKQYVPFNQIITIFQQFDSFGLGNFFENFQDNENNLQQGKQYMFLEKNKLKVYNENQLQELSHLNMPQIQFKEYNICQIDRIQTEKNNQQNIFKIFLSGQIILNTIQKTKQQFGFKFIFSDIISLQKWENSFQFLLSKQQNQAEQVQQLSLLQKTPNNVQNNPDFLDQYSNNNNNNNMNNQNNDNMNKNIPNYDQLIQQLQNNSNKLFPQLKKETQEQKLQDILRQKKDYNPNQDNLEPIEQQNDQENNNNSNKNINNIINNNFLNPGNQNTNIPEGMRPVSFQDITNQYEEQVFFEDQQAFNNPKFVVKEVPSLEEFNTVNSVYNNNNTQNHQKLSSFYQKTPYTNSNNVSALQINKIRKKFTSEDRKNVQNAYSQEIEELKILKSLSYLREGQTFLVIKSNGQKKEQRVYINDEKYLITKDLQNYDKKNKIDISNIEEISLIQYYNIKKSSDFTQEMADRSKKDLILIINDYNQKQLVLEAPSNKIRSTFIFHIQQLLKKYNYTHIKFNCNQLKTPAINNNIE